MKEKRREEGRGIRSMPVCKRSHPSVCPSKKELSEWKRLGICSTQRNSPVVINAGTPVGQLQHLMTMSLEKWQENIIGSFYHKTYEKEVGNVCWTKDPEPFKLWGIKTLNQRAEFPEYLLPWEFLKKQKSGSHLLHSGLRKFSLINPIRNPRFLLAPSWFAPADLAPKVLPPYSQVGDREGSNILSH